MKSLEKLKSVIRTIELSNGDGSFNSTLDLLHEFIVDNEPKQKKTAFRDFCSEKKQYPALTGVFHDAEKRSL